MYPSPAIGSLYLVNQGGFFLLFVLVRICVVYLLFRLDALNPFLERSVAFRKEMPGFPTSGTLDVGHIGGDGPSGLPVFREVQLDSRQGILDVLHHLPGVVFFHFDLYYLFTLFIISISGMAVPVLETDCNVSVGTGRC
jgi:hypothetical protein